MEATEKMEGTEAPETREKETVVVVRGMGCISQIISMIISLILLPTAFYYIYGWQLNKEKQARLESNEIIVRELRQVSDNIYYLSNLEITETNSEPAKTFFVFYRKGPQGTVQTTLDLGAYKLGGGVFKIYTPPIEISFGLKTALWFHEHIIEPQLPEYNFLLATPYSLEFCSSLGNCTLLKKTVGFTNENGKFSYFF